MAARVEVTVSAQLNPLNRIRWMKSAGWHNKCRPQDLRSYLSPWEEIIFAEHYGSDGVAKGEAGYAAKCDELRGFLFEPLRRYIVKEFEAAGIDRIQFNVICGFSPNPGGMASRHYLSSSQWCLPTAEHYAKLATATGRFKRPYETLRAEYETLRAEYETLRRPFEVSAEVPFTDVWAFPTVQAYPGKHPCEKPLAMMEHIVEASSRPGAVVLDCFMGSGTTAIACMNTGRHYIGFEKDKQYFKIAQKRIREHGKQQTFAQAA
jgi:site-specific DNA-methyltransferase (adenine-specific)